MPPVRLAVICDPGEDLDDELAIICIREFVERKFCAAPEAVVCNLRPALERARLMRGTLDALGFDEVPAGVGGEVLGEGGVDAQAVPPATYAAPASVAIEPGFDVLKRALRAAPDGSLTLLCISALTDAADFLRREPDLFRRKVSEVVIMGGTRETTSLVPDDAANNAFDPAAAGFFYAALQGRGIRTVVVGRGAAYAAPVPRSIYDDLAATGSAVGARLARNQRAAIQRLWRRSCAAGEDRAHLPARCDADWFRRTFCGGRGQSRTPADDMWDLVLSFNLYDVVALVAAVPQLRTRYFDPVVVPVDGVDHLVIGLDRETHNVRDGPALSRVMVRGILDGIRPTVPSTPPTPGRAEPA